MASNYEMFHGRSPKRKDALDFHVPRELTLLGAAVAIEYRCNKLNGGGDGKQAVYRHEFETPVMLAMDERHGKQLYIIGNRVTVTDRGIEH